MKRIRNPKVFTPIKMMKWAENNPIVAAYGIVEGRRKRDADTLTNSDRTSAILSARPTHKNTNNPESPIEIWLRHNSQSRNYFNYLSNSGDSFFDDEETKTVSRYPDPNSIALEWDVFLDPNIVEKVNVAIKNARKIIDLGKRIAAEVEVDRQVSRLINRMLLAHGSLTQLVAEAVGMAPKYNFSQVEQNVYKQKNGTSYGGNGIFVSRWLALFAEALKLGEQSNRCPHSLHLYENDGDLCGNRKKKNL